MTIDIGEWGLSRRDERLWFDGQDLTSLAERFGTPVHVASAKFYQYGLGEHSWIEPGL